MKKLITSVITIPVVSIAALRVAAILSGDVSIAGFAADVGPLAVVGVLGGTFALTGPVAGLRSAEC